MIQAKTLDKYFFLWAPPPPSLTPFLASPFLLYFKLYFLVVFFVVVFFSFFKGFFVFFFSFFYFRFLTYT